MLQPTFSIELIEFNLFHYIDTYPLIFIQKNLIKKTLIKKKTAIFIIILKRNFSNF